MKKKNLSKMYISGAVLGALLLTANITYGGGLNPGQLTAQEIVAGPPVNKNVVSAVTANSAANAAANATDNSAANPAASSAANANPNSAANAAATPVARSTSITS